MADGSNQTVPPAVRVPRKEDIIGPKCWKSIVFNWAVISQSLAVLLIILLLYSVAVCVLPPYYTSIESPLLRISLLCIGAKLIGIAVALFGIPDLHLLGMLFWGVLFRNLGLAQFDGLEGVESFLRDIALVNIMLLTGLALDLRELKQVVGIIAKLAILPTIAEVAVITIAGHFLIQLPWIWAVQLGLVLTAVSPNVVFSNLLDLKEKRLGMNNGIHTVIVGMTGCNNVLAIFVQFVVLGTIFSNGPLTDQILQGPIGVVVGLVFGGLAGYLLLYLPSKRAVYSDILRFGLTLCAALVSVLGSQYLGYPSGGVISCVTLALINGNGMKDYPEDKVRTYLNALWAFFKPISFALIAKELDLSSLDTNTLWQGSVILVLGLLLRITVGFICTAGGEFSNRERGYITLATLLPKATVQAIIGPIALDMAKRRISPDEEEVASAKIILMCSIVAIVITAPIGRILMHRLAPKWLKKVEEDDEAGQVNSAFE